MSAPHPTGTAQITSPVSPSRLRMVIQRSRAIVFTWSQAARARPPVAAVAAAPRCSTSRSPSSPQASTIPPRISPDACGETWLPSQIAAPPSRPVPPTLPAANQPAARPLSSGRVDVAISASSAAEAVAAVAWASVSTAVRIARWCAGSGRSASDASSAAVANTLARYQRLRWAPKSISGTQSTFHACGMNAVAESAPIAAIDIDACSSQ